MELWNNFFALVRKLKAWKQPSVIPCICSTIRLVFIVSLFSFDLAVDCRLTIISSQSQSICAICCGFEVAYSLFIQLCSSWEDFDWHSASRGPSAVAILKRFLFVLYTRLWFHVHVVTVRLYLRPFNAVGAHVWANWYVDITWWLRPQNQIFQTPLRELTALPSPLGNEGFPQNPISLSAFRASDFFGPRCTQPPG